MPFTGTWDELNPSPTLEATPNGASLTRIGKIDWMDIETLWQYVFPSTISTSGNNVIGVGVQHPQLTFLYATKLRIEPFTENVKQTGAATTTFDAYATYTHAKATITFETLKAGTVQFPEFATEYDPVPMLTHRWAIGGEFLTLPGQKFWWDSDDTQAAEDINAGKFIAHIDHSISWPRVVTPPWSGIRTCMAKCNNAAITMSTGTAAVETLLFLGAEAEKTVMSNGQGAYNLTYKFSERRVKADDSATWGSTVGGWNHYWRPDKGGFYYLQSGPSVGFRNIIIESVDLIGNLFPTS